MIAKEAVKAFLEKPRDSFEWIKKATRIELLSSIKEVCPEFNPKLKPFLHQLSSIYLGLCFDGFLYFLDMGTGKEQPLNSKILTPNGWKTMGDMKIGTEICHPFKGVTKVIGVHPQGFKDVYKVTFTDGSSAECGEEHLWQVTTPGMKWKNKGYRILSLRKIKERIKDTSNNLVHFIPITEPISFQAQNNIFEIHPYALGVLLGDGGLTTGGITLTKQDTELFDLVTPYLPVNLEFNKCKKITQTIVRKDRKNTTGHNCWNREIKNLNLNVKSNAKHIPTKYLYSSINNRIALLQGLMDTDGYVSVDGTDVEYSTSSLALAKDFKFLVQSLGGTVTSKIKAVNGVDYYIQRPVLHSSFPLFRLTRKKLRWEQRKGKYQPRRGIKSIEFIGRKRCQCITVSAEDGLYLTDDFIITHNSLISLNVIECRKQLNQIKKALVVVPNLVNIENWIEEIERNTNLTVVGLVGNRTERFNLIKNQADVYVINYDGLPIYTAEYKENKARNAKTKRKLRLNQKLLKEFALNFQLIVYDEIHHVKHTSTLTYKICEGLSNYSSYVIGMTGTPIGRDPKNFWAQFHIVDHGETLGNNELIYLQALFKPQAGYWGGMQWVFPDKNKEILYKMLTHRSLRYADYECTELPPLIVTRRPLKMAPDAAAVYRNLMIESINQGKERVKSSKQKRKNFYSKLRQVSSGFLYADTVNCDLDNEDIITSEKVTLTFNNPKLDAIEEILEDVPADCKVVIFHVFTHSGIEIANRLKKLKIKYAAMNATVTGTKVDEYRRFKQDPKTKVFIVNIASGGEGLNLQNASYCIFYEHSDRPDVQRQALKRCYRTGQTKKTFVFSLFMIKTVEERILDFLAEGKSLFDALIDGKIPLTNLLE